MVFGKDMDAWEARPNELEFSEKQDIKSLLPTWPEVKLFTIAGVGFFIDLYDIFVINMVVPILQVSYFGGKAIPWGLSGGVLKASANMGNIVGELLFGFLADTFGRQAVYGKELLLSSFAIIMMISVPNSVGPIGITIWITVFRFIMGIGIGGDYPMSATVVSERAHLRRRGALLCLVKSGQGWGVFCGALLAYILVRLYHNSAVNNLPAIAGAWRILVGFALIPALSVVYFRFTMAESTRFKEARKLQDDPERIHKLQYVTEAAAAEATDVGNGTPALMEEPRGLDDDEIVRRSALGFRSEGNPHAGEFVRYFAEWRHLKMLIGTSLSWLLLDISFYGINLNQSFILDALNFKSKNQYTNLSYIALGNLIIISAGYLPAYFFAAALIEILGRRFIQVIGFLITGTLLGVIGGEFANLTHHPALFFVLFSFLQFFFIFGPSTTVFMIPAEVFPSRVRASAHGLSAAFGRVGAIASALGMVQLSKMIGTNKVLLIFCATSIAGIPFSFLTPETKGLDADVIDRKELHDAAVVQTYSRI